MSDDRRKRILDAAEALFAEHGFHATPTAQIANQAEVPKGLLFYYFPRKIDLLLTLLRERLPGTPECDLQTVVREGDLAGTLVRLDRQLGLSTHESVVLRNILFRELSTHTDVGEHLRKLRQHLVELTESVLRLAVRHYTLDPQLLRQAAHTFTSAMLERADLALAGGTLPDLRGPARVIALALEPRTA